ncbi:MAG: ATP-grasp domain-containing protein [Verrucomicrobiota bacterium]
MSDDTQTIRVLVTAVAGGSIGEQVSKALRISGLPLWLATANIAGSEAQQNVVPGDARFLLPRASAPDYVDSVLAAARECGAHFLIPGSEVELGMLVPHTDRFAAEGVRLLANTASVVATCLDKNLFSRALADAGFQMPETLEPSSPDDVMTPSSGFPVLLKPAAGGGGSAMTFIAQDAEELAFFQRYLFRCGVRPLLQEYIGRADEEYTVGVLHLPDGSHAGTAVMRRNILEGMSNRLRVANRTSRKELGGTLAVSSGITQGKFVAHEPIARAARSMAEALGSHGPLNIQGRWDGSKFIPFEANPRFSGTTPMRAIAGFNEPALLIAHWLGLCLPECVTMRGGTFTRGLIEHFTPDGEVLLTSV